MRDVSTSGYKGYTITVVVFPKPDGKFLAQFSIEKDSDRVHLLRRSTVTETDHVHRSPNASGDEFDTLEQARDSARAAANAWIDAASAYGYEVRSVNEVTSGDFLSFEMFVGGRWREIRISGTALAILDKGERTCRLDVFEQHLATILRAAAPKALAAPDAPFVQLNEKL